MKKILKEYKDNLSFIIINLSKMLAIILICIIFMSLLLLPSYLAAEYDVWYLLLYAGYILIIAGIMTITKKG